MDITLQKSILKGKISAIPSKSYCHRVLIMASRADSKTVIRGLIKSQDVVATCRAIENLGAKVDWLNDTDCIIEPIQVTSPDGSMDVGESGSTLRFVLPQIAQLGVNRDILCHGRLPSRTNSELFKVLNEHGCSPSQSGDTISMQGRIMGGVYEIRGDISSQYISGLLMALSAGQEDTEIVVTSKIESESYIDITIEVMAMFGIVVQCHPQRYIIKGGQQIKANGEIIIDGDWSNATPWIVGSAIGNNINICGLKLGSGQGDEKVLNALSAMGAEISEVDGDISIKANKLKGATFSVADCPDLAPMLAVAMACAQGKSKIIDCERLRLKESDRIDAIIKTLTAVGIESYYQDGIVIVGGKVKGGTCQSFADHRIVMMATILSTVSEGNITILGAQAIDKSYPQFFQDYQTLGGKIYDRQQY